ncbi:STM4014 family protein [Streptomyces sp. NRRL F-5630]|uniref:STM4014 family protein n=1 Tax=Streptomyces sp. NRRL F-5630 TaxID=1463864 RepID=UPI003D715EA5
MTPVRTGPPLAVVGNPENRRVRLLAEAARRAGLPAPRVVPWLRVLTEGGVEFAPDEVVRLDSPGENPEVDTVLRGPGPQTRVGGSARWYAGLLDAVAGLRGGRRLDDPDELAVLFDKRHCHARLNAAGVPVPYSPTSGGAATVTGWDDVRALMAGHGLNRLFVKPAHGSSASGVLAIDSAGPGRIRAVTPVETAPDGELHNSLRPRTLRSETEIGALVDRLAPEGLHLERWWPKATQSGRSADLRVLVVAGRATHAVVRTGGSPLTNLHLGGRRGDLEAARNAFDAAGLGWTKALEVCERAAACFPRTLSVGVDLLPARGWSRVAVGEVNAFGDLLPGLTGLPGSGAEGLDTYGAQLAALPAFTDALPTPLARP